MNIMSSAEHRYRLRNILQNIDKSDIYRPVYDKNGELLAEGFTTVKPQLVDDYCKIDFAGKSVVDLGCNFGFFTFLAARQGAKHVTGLDYLPEVVEGSRHLAALLGYENVSFRTFNIEKPDTSIAQFDIAMLVDFFGKSNIRKQKINRLLNFLKSLSDTELVLAFRPINRIEKDLKLTSASFSRLYPAKYISGGLFYLIDYIYDNMADQWEMSAVSEFNGEVSKDKLLFHCKRK